MTQIELNAKSRDTKNKPKKLIEDGFIPGVIYNQSGKSFNVNFTQSDIDQFLQMVEGTTIVKITVDGKDEYMAQLKEIQKDIRKNTPYHLSFMGLDDKKQAVFSINVVPTGISGAVRNNLGVFLIIKKTVDLRGLPKDIPQEVSMDISSLDDVGDTILAKDLKIPEGLEFIREEDKELPVATIRPFQKTREEEEAEEKALKEAEMPEGEEGEIIEGDEGEQPEGEEGAEGETSEADEKSEQEDSED